MSDRIIFRVHGTPAPQGSKRHVGKGVMVESSTKVKPWRQDVKYAALEAKPVTVDGMPPFMVGVAVSVQVIFYLARPAGHYGSGKNAARLKPSAPMRPSRKPDLDKLLRSTLDALGEAGIWADDAQVVHVSMDKRFADDRPAGAYICIEESP